MKSESSLRFVKRLAAIPSGIVLRDSRASSRTLPNTTGITTGLQHSVREATFLIPYLSLKNNTTPSNWLLELRVMILDDH